MRYRIEFLLETTEEHSVCMALLGDRKLDVTMTRAFAHAAPTQVEFGAGSFQVRDMDNEGQVVAIEEFAPMGHA